MYRYIAVYRNPHHGPEPTGAAGPFPDEDTARQEARRTPLGAEFEIVPLIIDTEEDSK